MRRMLRVILAALLVPSALACRRADEPAPLPPATRSDVPTVPLAPGTRLYEVNGVRVLTLYGTPEEMGRAHGTLLRDDVRWVVETVVRGTVASDDARREAFLARVDVMERHLKDAWRRELRALADAAGVDYRELVALQLFGDVERAPMCSSFAVFGRATATGECVVGRNFDYWYEEVARRASIILDYHPKDGRRFVTLSWAGVINGWTLMNDAGIVAANNTAYSAGANSLEGISTCFMLRKVAEEAATVDEGAIIVERGPRACSTNLIIAGGNPPAAAVAEYDHERIVVRRAKDGFILATNSFLELGETAAEEPTYGRYGVMNGLIRENYGKIDRTMNFAGADGVPIESINLHSALMFPKDLTFRAAMGAVPACRGEFKWFRMTPDGIAPANDQPKQEPTR